MEVNDLVPIDFSNQRVLTSEQLAEVYGTTADRIKNNFRYAKKQFEEGVHYFKATGEQLREVKERVNEERKSSLLSPIPKMANALYFWTLQGAARHCKMLNTQKAWDVFDKLEKNYFQQQAATVPVETSLFPEEKPRPVIAAVDFTALVERMDNLELLVQTLIDGLAQNNALAEKQLTKTERGRELLQIADRLPDSQDRQKLLLHAANLINGKKIF